MFSIQIVTPQPIYLTLSPKMEEDMNTLSDHDGTKLEEASLKDSQAQKARPTVRCEYCDKEVSSNNIREHINGVHLKLKEPCPDCGKSFPKRYLKMHREAVHLKKQKECPDCGKAFKIIHLTAHRRYSCKGTNITETKVICHLCGKEYFKHRLQKHIRRVHNGKAGKADVQSEYAQCDLCPKRIIKGNMKRHQAFHRRVFIKALCV